MLQSPFCLPISLQVYQFLLLTLPSKRIWHLTSSLHLQRDSPSFFHDFLLPHFPYYTLFSIQQTMWPLYLYVRLCSSGHILSSTLSRNKSQSLHNGNRAILILMFLWIITYSSSASFHLIQSNWDRCFLLLKKTRQALNSKSKSISSLSLKCSALKYSPTTFCHFLCLVSSSEWGLSSVLIKF